MKIYIRITALILALVMGVSLVACDGTTPCESHTDRDSNGICDVCEMAIEKPAAKRGNKVGDLCYSHKLNRLNADGQVSIDDYRGKVVIINFWGTWCNPCKNELPHFSKIAEDYAADAVVLGVHSSWSGEESAESYVESNYADSHIVFCKDARLSASADVYYNLLGGNGYYPYTLVLDRDGVITYSASGALDYDDLALLIDGAK